MEFLKRLGMMRRSLPVNLSFVRSTVSPSGSANGTAYAEAMARMRTNPRAVWAPQARDGLKPEFAASRIHDGYADVLAPKPFKLRRDQRFFCVGSCFAREIEDAITAEGYVSETRDRSLEMVDQRPDLFSRASEGPGRPNAFLNRYNSPSMALLMQDIVANVLGEALLVGPKDRKIDFHYTRFIRPLPRDLALERREIIRRMYAKAMAASDIFVFTLGLCETFFDRASEMPFNVTPDPRTAKGTNLEFRFADVDANVAMLRKIVSALRQVRPDAQVVLTVSPVPLDLTFTGLDVVVANSLAKSTLVASAHLVAAEIEGCHYFPSYEMVMNSEQSRAWMWDRKHVAAGMVGHIMKSFVDRHLD